MREISLPLPWSTVGKISVRLQAVTRGLWRLIKEKPLGAFGGVIVLGLLLCALLAPWIATNPYDQTNVRNRLKPPSSQFYFGTDNLGRDIFSRVIVATRLDLAISLSAVALSFERQRAPRTPNSGWRGPPSESPIRPRSLTNAASGIP